MGSSVHYSRLLLVQTGGGVGMKNIFSGSPRNSHLDKGGLLGGDACFQGWANEAD